MNRRAWVIVITLLVVAFEIIGFTSATENPPTTTKEVVVPNPDYAPGGANLVFGGSNRPNITKNVTETDKDALNAIVKRYYLMIGVTLIGGVVLAFVINPNQQFVQGKSKEDDEIEDEEYIG